MLRTHRLKLNRACLSSRPNPEQDKCLIVKVEWKQSNSCYVQSVPKSKFSFSQFSLENLLTKRFLWTEQQELSLFYNHFGAFPF